MITLKNIPCHIKSEVSFKKFYFALFHDGLINFKHFEMGVYQFWHFQTLQIYKPGGWGELNLWKVTTHDVFSETEIYP